MSKGLRLAPGWEWLDLRTLIRDACVSERAVRTWIHQLNNPLPAVQVGNKLFVKVKYATGT